MGSERCNKILLFLKVISFLILLVIFIFFVSGVFQKYTKLVTTFGSKTENVDYYETPVLTICSKEAYKKSVLLKYNINSLYFFNPGSIDLSKNTSVKAMYYEATFRLDKDFNLTIFYGNSSGFYYNLTLALGVTYIQENNLTVEVIEMPTQYFGMCYTIFSDIKVEAGTYFAPTITRWIDHNNEKMTGFKMYFSSRKKYLGLLFGTAVPLHIDFEFGTFYYCVQLFLEEWRFYPKGKTIPKIFFGPIGAGTFVCKFYCTSNFIELHWQLEMFA